MKMYSSIFTVGRYTKEAHNRKSPQRQSDLPNGDDNLHGKRLKPGSLLSVGNSHSFNVYIAKQATNKYIQMYD